ncbi:MAG TPA: hypothetical protein VK213_14530 [Bacteroidales bacterium]|nr:hypothetical protein [Bacteroidales bacterium]
MPCIFQDQFRADWSEHLSLLFPVFSPEYKHQWMKRLLILFLISASAISVFAQGELDEQQRVFFRNERSLGLQLNSDGIGISYRAGKRIDYLNKRLIEIDAGTLRSAKEYRQRHPYSQSGAFVFGKLNSAFYLRAGYGHQHELFSKEDFGGIAIRYFYAGGPVLAIYKPIYYSVLYLVPGSGNEYIQKEEKFDPNSIAIPQDIFGRAGFTKGLRETKVLPGLYARGGFNFEYSKQDKAIHAIEIGVQLNAFAKEVPIMAIASNKQLFPSIFVCYRFGMILDPLHPESNSILNIFRRNKE